MNEPLETARQPGHIHRAIDIAALIFSTFVYGVMIWVVLHSFF